MEKRVKPKEEATSSETEERPGVKSSEVIATKEAKTAVAVTLGEGESSIESKTDGGAAVEQGAKAAVSSDGKEMPTAAVRAAAAGQGTEPAMALEEKAAASPESIKKKEKAKDGFTAQPETTAAEKVHGTRWSSCILSILVQGGSCRFRSAN